MEEVKHNDCVLNVTQLLRALFVNCTFQVLTGFKTGT